MSLGLWHDLWATKYRARSQVRPHILHMNFLEFPALEEDGTGTSDVITVVSGIITDTSDVIADVNDVIVDVHDVI